MSQIQFRSDDTTKWGQGYGNGSAGIGSINTSTDSPTGTTFTGISGAFVGVFGSTSGFANNDIVIIHQSQGTGAGTWQFNYIVDISTSKFLYPLVATFGIGCQIQKIPQYTNLTINSGQTLTTSAWNGTTSGIYAAIANGMITVTGNITATGKGYRGQSGVGGASVGGQGEGTSAAGGTQATGANGNGGGGGGYSTNVPWNQGNGGAGGSNSQTNAENGTGTGGGGNQGGAAGTMGAAAGAVGLTTMVFGGAGGAGGTDSNGTSGASGNGGGIVILIGRTITVTGTITASGNIGTDSLNAAGSGGSGAGGSFFIKGQTVTLGSSLLTANGGAHVVNGGDIGDRDGGAGGVGRIHADYATSIIGTTSPTIDSTNDGTLANGIFGGMI